MTASVRGRSPAIFWDSRAAWTVITDRGRPAHVLLTFEAYEELIGRHRVVDLLAEPAGIEDIGFTTPRSTERASPAQLD